MMGYGVNIYTGRAMAPACINVHQRPYAKPVTSEFDADRIENVTGIYKINRPSITNAGSINQTNGSAK
ncbi:hypothetical protein [Massilia sp. PWRC2]|uniref:hypothetical protein n=1 Tax=Massilia sp. PWRC2 TaxID=2804626 RepID=UPI003CF3FE20